VPNSVWQNIVWDLHVADAACEKWLRSPATWWPKLVPYLDEDEDPEEVPEPRDVLERVHGANLREGAASRTSRSSGLLYHPLVGADRAVLPGVLECGGLTEGFELSERTPSAP
jgi:hypothetical protein